MKDTETEKIASLRKKMKDPQKENAQIFNESEFISFADTLNRPWERSSRQGSKRN